MKMTLITCPECGNDVSNRAQACPHCGFPLTEKTEEQTGIPRQKYIRAVVVFFATISTVLCLLTFGSSIPTFPLPLTRVWIIVQGGLDLVAIYQVVVLSVAYSREEQGKREGLIWHFVPSILVVLIVAMQGLSVIQGVWNGEGLIRGFTVFALLISVALAWLGSQPYREHITTFFYKKRI